jgi:adenosylcobalamin-dependent ribonucleoside-diphosphate reductase
MKFTRLFSKPDQPVAEQIEWKTVNIKVPATGETQSVEVPAWWSDNAAMILVRNYLRKAGVPSLADLAPVPEGTVPTWLNRSTLIPHVEPKLGAETSARQVFHRMAGCWTYWGWRSGVFKGTADPVETVFGATVPRYSLDEMEENARIFYDECYMMLARQIGAPNSPQWFNTGLHWAYGIEGPASGQWAIDYERKPDDAWSDLPGHPIHIYETTNSYERPQPHACFIQPVSDDLVNPGGIMDLWLREVRLFKYGSGTGTNFSRVRGRGEPLSGGGKSSGLMSFLRIGDRAAGSIKSGGTTRRAAKMVIVDADHPEVADFIDWKAKEEYKAAAMYVGSRLMKEVAIMSEITPPALIDRFEHGLLPEILGVDFEGEAIDTVGGQNSNNSVRVTDDFMKRAGTGPEVIVQAWELKARTDGSTVKLTSAKDLFDRICRAAWACADPGLQFHDTINEWHTCPNDGVINASNPCSEYMFLDDTACNLASINLVSCLHRELVDGSGSELDYEAFTHAVRLWTVVLDISVTMASFPSKEIALGSYNYRTLGLGYANLGGLLMRLAIPYDSDEGRALAAAITALMHFTAYRTSNEMAKELGPFPRWEANRDPMARVIEKHHQALLDSGAVGIASDIRHHALLAWNAIDPDAGFRNAQVTLLAPTGTISFVMDCDTTGVEPDFALVKDKNLAGGGQMKIVNQSVLPALERLGYNEDGQRGILLRIRDHGDVEGTVISPQHKVIFATANEIRPMAHVEMVAAVQPFLSGAVSKTINMPNSATVDDVSEVYRRSWELKLKAVALYRDGCKLAQPLSAAKPEAAKQDRVKPSVEALEAILSRPDSHFKVYTKSDGSLGADDLLPRGTRERLPARRGGYTQKARVGGQTVYLRTGEWPDGRLGEIFVDLANAGSTLDGFANCLAKMTSIALQFGAPADKVVEALLGTRFEPDGVVEEHDRVKMAASIPDFVAKDIAINYLGREDLANTIRMVSVGEGKEVVALDKRAVALAGGKVMGRVCPACHAGLILTGTCWSCPSCSFSEGGCG